MTIWLHTTILATSLAATIAIGIASAAKYDAAAVVAPKADMLPLATDAKPDHYVTVEPRRRRLRALRIPAACAATTSVPRR